MREITAVKTLVRDVNVRKGDAACIKTDDFVVISDIVVNFLNMLIFVFDVCIAEFSAFNYISV